MSDSAAPGTAPTPVQGQEQAREQAKGIDSVPAADQLIEHNGTIYTTIREGLAHILVPPTARTQTDPKAAGKQKQKNKSESESADGGGSSAAVEQVQSVFYNPIQQFNRDLSVLGIRAFGEDVCARRRLKSQSARAKKERKRLVGGGRERNGDEDGDGEVKRRKGNDGSSVSVAKKDVQAEAAESNVQLPDEATQAGEQSESVEGDKMDVEQQAANPATNGTSGPQASEKAAEYPPKFRILDALSATGLRALRYAHEIPFATSVVSNDMSEAAVASIALNVRHNKLASKIQPSTGNAIGHMYQAAYAAVGSSPEAWAQGKYDVVDLDPYGTAVPFLDAAIQSLNDGGLLCVTCTDAGVFASCGYPEKTFSLYGGLPVKGPHSHEAGLRLILFSIASSAAKYGIAIEPLLSLSIDYYARVFVRIKKSPADVKFLAGKTMVVHSCDSGCGAWQTQYLARHTAQAGRTNYKHGAAQSSSGKACPHCGFKTHVAGPMWGGPIHNPFFIQRILDLLPKVDKDVYRTTQRIEGMLTSALDELDVLHPSALEAQSSTDAPFIPSMPHHALDPNPFFFIPSVVAKVLHCVAPSEAAIKGALRKAGYVATRSHCKPGTIKTQANWEVVWEVMREWVRQKAPIKEGKIKEKTPATKILGQMRKVGESVEVHEGVAEVEVEANGEGEAKEANQDPNTRRGNSPPREDVKRMKVVFDEKLGKDRTVKKLTRYQQNPRENWGPMARAHA